MVDESRKLLVVDEEGREFVMEIMFTFTEKGKNYIVYFNPEQEAEEVTLFASIYDDDGNLYPIESDEEWNLVDKVISAFMNDKGASDEEVDGEEIA